MALGLILGGVSAAASIAGGISDSNRQAAAAENVREWDRYNAEVGNDNVIANINTQMMLSDFVLDLEAETVETQTNAIKASTKRNAGIIRDTAIYNSRLLDNELNILWDGVGLDLMQLETERARERGEIIANQSASGTVIGEGSNAVMLIEQKTQEKLDAFILRHGANIQASKIMNAKAKSLWEGEVQAANVEWEGDVNVRINEANYETRRIGTIGDLAIRSSSTLNSARSTFFAAMGGAETKYNQSMMQAQNTLTNGIFSGISLASNAYYNYKSLNT